MRVNQRIIYLKPVHNKAKSSIAMDSVSERVKRVNFQSSSILNCGASRFASVSNHLQPLLLLCIKGFIILWGEQTLSHIPEKLLITRAIYQLSFNKYNKACLNTNLAKTPNLFTVEFQKLLQISVRETCRFMFTRIFHLHHDELWSAKKFYAN